MPSFQDVAAYLKPFGFEALIFSEPTPTAPAAAAVIGCSVAEIAKTILVTVGSELVAVVTSGDTRIHSPFLKESTRLRGKVRMLDGDRVVELVDYPPGGVCPFLLPSTLPVILDKSLKRFSCVYPAAGTPASGVAITVSRLPELTGGHWAEVCRILEEV